MASNAESEETKVQTSGFNAEPGGDIVGKNTTSSASPDQQLQEWIQPVTEFLSQLPDYLATFFADYKKPITTVGLIIGALIAVKFTLAILDAINDIPLMSPMLELIGLAYTSWFVYRYLLKASNRQELWGEFDSLKNQVAGNKSAE